MTTILWFLGWGNFSSEIKKVTEFLNIFAVLEELAEEGDYSNIWIYKK